MNLNNETFRKQVIAIITYLFISFFFVLLSVVHFFDPFYILTDKLTLSLRSNLYTVGANVEMYISGLSRVNSLVTENNSLKQKLASLQSLTAQNAALEEENTALRDQLGISLPQKKKLIFSLIISRDTVLDSLVINKGGDDGVAKNDILVYKNILLGQVIDVFPQTAKVQLVTSTSASIPVQIAGSQVNGILGNSLDGTVMSDILPDETVNVGDSVITSGLGGIFPIGLLVGNVSSVTPVSSQPFKEASVNLAFNISDTAYAFILKTQ